MQQNRAMDVRRIPLSSTTLSISALAFELSPFLFQSKDSMQIALVAPASASIRRLHSHSMEELLLNPHYNQS
ncbi:hypothetical protein OROMI_034524 [Orobanche minor]